MLAHSMNTSCAVSMSLQRIACSATPVSTPSVSRMKFTSSGPMSSFTRCVSA